MKKHSFHNQDQEGLFSRRKMLSVLGVAGLSGMSTTAVAREKEIQKKADKSPCIFYDSVVEMKQDRSLKEGDCIETKGYYEAGDGGHAKYQVIKSPEKADEGGIIALRSGLAAELINVDKVNYKMFGARSDGKNDDGEQIKAAHHYANENDIPVENTRGDFWIGKTDNIVIQTDVHWGKTVFHIDERQNTRTARFKVSGRRESIKITLSDMDKKAVLEGLKNKDTNIPALARYADSLIVIVDANDKVGARQGGNAHPGRNKQDFFVVEEDGRILGEVFLDFKDYTSLTVYPAERSYLTIEGGTFFLSGHSSDVLDKGYMSNGIQVQRSRTIIKNQWVGVEPGNKDIAMLSRSGFYSFSRAYDLQLKNVRLIPWEKTRGTKETNVPQGTYGISGNVIMNVLFSNITAEAGRIHWGVFGTNYTKNIRLEKCTLNRFDVHSYGYNIHILDSQIGAKGITVTGGGELRVENSSCRGSALITFRSDYGSRWDGDILVRNCTYYPAGVSAGALLRYATRDVDYMYNIGYGRSITIEDVKIDYEENAASGTVFWLIAVSSIKSYEKSGKLFFPDHIALKNISVKGREKGVRIMRVPSPDSFLLPKKFSYDGSFLSCNAKILLENIQLEHTSLGGSHISFDPLNGTPDEKSLVPFVRIKDCDNVICNMGRNLGELMLEDSVIDHVSLGGEEKYKGSVTFVNCKFRPYYAKDKVLRLDTVLGTSFVNCQLFLPQYSDTAPEDLLTLYSDFMKINGKVRFSHLGTRLGQDVLSYLKNKSVQLSPEFIVRLKAHHELED